MRLKSTPSIRSIMKLSTLLIIALLLALMASAPFAVAKNDCQPHQCEWLQDPGADCGVKEYGTLISTFMLPAAKCEGNSDKGTMVNLYKVTRIKCCENIHRCCDYVPCGETGCAIVPGSCKDNPAPQTCEVLETYYKISKA
jgi:hypothetical protein